MALADTLGAICAFLNLPPGAGTSTIESKTNFFAPVRSGHIEAVTHGAARRAADDRAADRRARRDRAAGRAGRADAGGARRLMAGRILVSERPAPWAASWSPQLDQGGEKVRAATRERLPSRPPPERARPSS